MPNVPVTAVNTYSFADVNCTLVGPNGVVTLGAGAGVAEEGITFEPTEDVDDLKTGADGTPMHTLRAGRPARATVRLLKTSPTNGILSQMFAQQTSTGTLHGKNTITVTDPNLGDLCAGLFTAFARHAPVTWAKDANFNEWTFNVGYYAPSLGTGG